MSDDEFNRISGLIVDSTIAVHRVLGSGLLESAYKACLTYELRKRGVEVASEVALPVVYEGCNLEADYRIGLLVANTAVVEVKAADALAPFIARSCFLT